MINGTLLIEFEYDSTLNVHGPYDKTMFTTIITQFHLFSDHPGLGVQHKSDQNSKGSSELLDQLLF